MFARFKSPKYKWVVSLVVIALIVAAVGIYVPAARVQAYSGFPTFNILSVVKDTSVTIQTTNLPPDQTFTVRMGKIGTRGIGGTVVATTDSGTGGSQKLTYTIPDALKGLAQIAIRMDSPAGYFAYNWFDNVSATIGTPSPTSKTPTIATPSPTSKTITPAFTGIPTFSILSVVQDTSVTIKTNNFPGGKTFTVRMGAFGTRAIGGVVIGAQDSGSGGVFQATFNIPDSLKGSSRIAIRMDSTTGGFFAYNWFFNSTATGSGTPAATLTGKTATPGGPTATPTVKTATPGGKTATPAPSSSNFPTFSISAVVKDTSVTIKGVNFPPGQTFTVRMGKIGTKAIGGIVVGTKDSGAGGAIDATFNIPADLKGLTQIAIRMDSPAGFFAYNWFWNVNAP